MTLTTFSSSRTSFRSLKKQQLAIASSPPINISNRLCHTTLGRSNIALAFFPNILMMPPLSAVSKYLHPLTPKFADAMLENNIKFYLFYDHIYYIISIYNLGLPFPTLWFPVSALSAFYQRPNIPRGYQFGPHQGGSDTPFEKEGSKYFWPKVAIHRLDLYEYWGQLQNIRPKSQKLSEI